MNQLEKAKAFAALHVKGSPIILFNIWDPGSAATVENAGAKALATGSAPVALAHGFADGEKIPLEMALDNVSRIVAGSDLPVTLDLEGGYGAAPDAVANTVGRALETGVVGFNFEDQIVGGDGLHAIDVQSERVAASRKAAESAGIPAFVNARTDIFLKAKPDTHSMEMLAEAIDRAQAYAEAGASGFFAPGLVDEEMIGKLCDAAPLPVNIIALPHAPPNTTLAKLGVARISYGPVPYRQMMAALGEAATLALGG